MSFFKDWKPAPRQRGTPSPHRSSRAPWMYSNRRSTSPGGGKISFEELTWEIDEFTPSLASHNVGDTREFDENKVFSDILADSARSEDPSHGKGQRDARSPFEPESSFLHADIAPFSPLIERPVDIDISRCNSCVSLGNKYEHALRVAKARESALVEQLQQTRAFAKHTKSKNQALEVQHTSPLLSLSQLSPFLFLLFSN